MKINDNDILLSSEEARKLLKVSSCDLMHLRTAGKLAYTKKGNAFLYHQSAIVEFIKLKKH
jgi:hypothetical protein